MVKFSIILRAYNVEHQLKRSVESILQQDYSNWELIIVNDGSSDGTGSLCNQYAKQEERVRVLHQENGGCLRATQEGIKISTGEYICVLDADDWYEKNYLTTVAKILEKKEVDMIVVNYCVVNSAGNKKLFYQEKEIIEMDSSSAILMFLDTTNYALWNKVVRKEMICYTESEKNFFWQFGKMTNFGEDLYQLMPVLCNCDKVCFTPECLYNYVLDETSISHKEVKNYEQELIKRNRLMEFTYNAIKSRNYMNDTIKKRLQINTIIIMLPIIKKIIRRGMLNRRTLTELNESDYYNAVVKRTSITNIKGKVGTKNTMVFWLFNKLLCMLK